MIDIRIQDFITCAVILTILSSPVFTDSGGSLSGRRTPCTHENEEFPVQFLKNITNCYKCICRNGFVECDPEMCPALDECYTLNKKQPGGCCETCKECEYKGVTYKSGVEWSHQDDPCIHYKCVSGVITESIQKCYTQCGDPKPPREGQCCPTCLGCYLNGLNLQDGREVTLSEDPCVKCTCTGKRLTCVKKACPVLQCPLTKQKIKPGDCCPICVEQVKNMYSVLGKCVLAKKLYSSDKPYNLDFCSKCSCHNGTSVCRRETCPILECSHENQIKLPQDCCPQCLQVAEARTTCSLSTGQVYQNNQTWQVDQCQTCECRDGNIRCVRKACPNLKCGPNEKKMTLSGECCSKCVENPGVCTVYGDPHYKTFDGFHYSFQGSCKYLLADDCIGNSFTIRVTNDDRGKRHSAWTKTVTLKMGHTKVTLGQKMRVKVNGTRVVQYPFEGPGLFINKSIEEGITVDTEIGVGLSWDGISFTQVLVPASYKEQMCGLCGNYDLSTRDELKTREGRVVSERSVYEFADSWRVGGTKACAREQDVKMAPGRWTGNKWVGGPKALRAEKCKSLANTDSIEDVFANCHSKINSLNYFEACKMDMAECPNKFCYCDSFTAYARECQRIGIELPNWRERTNCTLNKMLARSNVKRRQRKQQRQQQQKVQRRRHKNNKGRISPYEIPDFVIPHILHNRTAPPIQ